MSIDKDTAKVFNDHGFDGYFWVAFTVNDDNKVDVASSGYLDPQYDTLLGPFITDIGVDILNKINDNSIFNETVGDFPNAN